MDIFTSLGDVFGVLADTFVAPAHVSDTARSLVAAAPTAGQVGFAALVAGTPGPFTIALLSIGTRDGARGGLGFLFGGAVVYGAIWALSALFTREVEAWGGPVFEIMRYTGLALVAWLAWKLVSDDGAPAEASAGAGRGGIGGGGIGGGARLGLAAGAALNLFNPKAWMSGLLATTAFGTGAVSADATVPAAGGAQTVLAAGSADTVVAVSLGLTVTGLALVLCGVWLVAGGALGARMRSGPARMWFNRSAAVLLVLCFLPAL